MKIFEPVFKKIVEWKTSKRSQLEIVGVNKEQSQILINEIVSNLKTNSITKKWVLTYHREEDAEESYNIMKEHFENSDVHIFHLHHFEGNPYQKFISNDHAALRRFSTLFNLQKVISDKNANVLLFASIESLMLKSPPLNFFLERRIVLNKDDILGPSELSKKLIQLGYVANLTAEEPGTFSKRGEIFDIYPANYRPIRIHYFDDLIENLFFIDVSNQKTLKDETIDKIEIGPTPLIFANEKSFHLNLMKKVQMPQPQQKAKYRERQTMLDNLKQGLLFENYQNFIPLFFENPKSIIEDLNSNSFTFIVNSSEKVYSHIDEYLETLREAYQQKEIDTESENIVPDPSELIDNKFNFHSQIKINQLDIERHFDETVEEKIDLSLIDFDNYIKTHIPKKSFDRYEYIKQVLELLKKIFDKDGSIYICYQKDHTLKELQNIFEVNEFSNNIKSRIIYLKINLEKGFYYKNEKALFISENDIFLRKKSSSKETKTKNFDLFAEQLASLKINDYVVHSEYGVGIYLGLETLEHNGIKSDFIGIQYESNDKIYVPVYKMNLVQKYADSSSPHKLASLRTNKFHLAKQKARDSAKKLAFDLLKLQAERQSHKAYAFSAPDELDHAFEQAFRFDETKDQRSAIDDVLEDMQKASPMDRLICGDVGFGKTEVAMRAAFKAVNDKKQVAVLVPTTILALQHFYSFTDRFKGFPVNIEFLSRFKNAKETKEIIAKIAEGKVDIIIGTHKILSSKIQFRDLGLVIIDEEQRFGVAHKEQFKLLKTTVDFLTLSATPIPRTLQMAFLGIRDLSVIQTPPINRQAIKTYLIKDDDETIKTALRKELKRGGQVFFVHNKVSDIDEVSARIRELAPDSSIVVGHGQLPENDLEKRMDDFYHHKYQILISTTIIESGIDIPNANTMIIYNAQNFGLSQLHQLRGRIGRSDRKAYAYFVVPENKRLTDIAQKRLEALKTFDQLGAGFSIASADLELRGAGEMLGANQSGHIEEVGLELYMELLKEAVAEIKGEKTIFNQNIEIQVSFPFYIPNNYVEDPSERLKFYKKLSGAKSESDLQDIRVQIEDVYGRIPEELNNLFIIMETKGQLQSTGIKLLSLQNTNAIIQFDEKQLIKDPGLRNKIIDTFMASPKLYKFTPDFKVVCYLKKPIEKQDIAAFAKNIAQQILPC